MKGEMHMQSISGKLRDQIFEWLEEIQKTGQLLTLIEEMSNAYSASMKQNASGFDVYQNYQNCFVVIFFPYQSTDEMSELEKNIGEKIRTIPFNKNILDRIKVFMESLEDVQKCERLGENKLRIHF